MKEPTPILGGSASATFAADGTATATVGPVPLGQTWTIDRTTVQTNSAARTRATIYRNSALPGNTIDTSRSGNGDTSGITYRLMPGEAVVCVWAAGNADDLCSFSIEGWST